jgi:6-phosphogluconolactonase
LPQGYSGDSTVADIHVAPSGRYVYVSNRGHDSLAVYKVDKRSGRLTFTGHVSTGGEIPRNFGIDPSEEYLLAGNQNSGTVVVFKMNHETGLPVASGEVLSVPSPVCIQFVDL